MAGVRIDLPLEFQATGIEKFVRELQAKLNTLEIDPTKKGNISAIFDKLLAQAKNFEKASAKGFVSSQTEVSKLESGAKQLSSTLSRGAKEMGKLADAGRLKTALFEKPTQEVKELMDRIAGLRAQLQGLKDNAVQSLFSSDIGKDVKASMESWGIDTSVLKTEQEVNDAIRERIALLEKERAARGREQEYLTARDKLTSQYGDSARDRFSSGKKKDFINDPEMQTLLSQFGALEKMTFATARAHLDELIDAAKVASGMSLDEINNGLTEATTASAQFAAGLQQVTPSITRLDGEIQDSEQELNTLANETINRTIAQLNHMGNQFTATSDKMNDMGDDAALTGEQLGRAFDQNASITNFNSRLKQLLGIGAIFRQVSRMVKNAVNQIKELDSAMTSIAVVTTMTTNELWKQIDAYMAIAKQYGVTTAGTYQVSQLYYQMGLETNEVMKLTTETLKMAKIASLDYAEATDYMTVAINGFKLEVEDASRVVDVYSRLAAISASDTAELAEAMSKTASIAQSAGMAFESTSAMIAMMVETTREAASNIGTAVKTIVA